MIDSNGMVIVLSAAVVVMLAVAVQHFHQSLPRILLVQRAFDSDDYCPTVLNPTDVMLGVVQTKFVSKRAASVCHC